MIYVISALLGAFSNLYRGGVFGESKDNLIKKIKPEWLSKTVDALSDGKLVNSLIFAVFCSYVIASEQIGTSSGVPYYELVAGAGVVFVCQFLVMLRFSAPGWGEYIGAAGGWRPTDKKPIGEEVEYIDRFIKGIKDRPRLWGVAGLSLRCGEWGFFLGAPLIGFIGFGALFPLMAGLLAGPVVYGLSFIPVLNKRTWQWFEVILGALFFTSIILGA